nr:uncharacterized protein LOC105465792 [Macaca nemestrina]
MYFTKSLQDSINHSDPFTKTEECECQDPPGVRVTERSAPLPPAQPPAGVRRSPLETPTSRGSAAPAPTPGRQGAGGSSSPGASRPVPLPRPAGHSRIFTRRGSRRTAAACRASRRRCSAAVRWPSAAAWPSSSPKMSPAQRDRGLLWAEVWTRSFVPPPCHPPMAQLLAMVRGKRGGGRRKACSELDLWWKGITHAGLDSQHQGPVNPSVRLFQKNPF